MGGGRADVMGGGRVEGTGGATEGGGGEVQGQRADQEKGESICHIHKIALSSTPEHFRPASSQDTPDFSLYSSSLCSLYL